jgi:hypothetical protein
LHADSDSENDSEEIPDLGKNIFIEKDIVESSDDNDGGRNDDQQCCCHGRS